MNLPGVSTLNRSLPQPLDTRWGHRLTQLLFALSIIVCFLLFWGAAALLGIPEAPLHGGSLLRQDAGASIAALVAAALLMGGCTWFATILLGRRWFLAGLAAAVAGMSGWSMRGGPMQQVLLYASSPSVFLILALETLLLGGIVAALWLVVWEASRPSSAALESDGARPMAAVVAQCVVMAILVLVIAQTDAKKQAIAAVFLAALVGTSIADGYFPSAENGRWYWVGPLAVGTVGYLLNWVSAGQWADGSHELEGTFAGLASPLPLDYATAGMFGALIGYWMNQRVEEGE